MSRAAAELRPARTKVAVLWAGMSGYLAACLKELAARPDVDLLVSWQLHSAHAPFDTDSLAWGGTSLAYDGHPDSDVLIRELEDFGPDVILICGWHIAAFRKIARRWRGRATRVLCMDNQWRGTAKQWAGILASPAIIRPHFDRAFVSGPRQAEFAARLGFRGGQITEGVYACDRAEFAVAAERRRKGAGAEGFLFVGRLVPVKGIRTLAEGYRAYRSMVRRPWPLRVIGDGPLAELLQGEGVERQGFVQPADLPEAMLGGSCLVLPSDFEPWGVVLHEAASAGMAIICSEACGAGDVLVDDGRNGRVVPTGSAAALAQAMAWVSGTTDEARQAMAAESAKRAEYNSPQIWATTVLSFLRPQAGRT